MELFKRNACDLSEMIKNKEISSAELTKSVFDRIKAVEGKVDAYLTLDEENAMKKATEIDEKLAKGEELSPLAGIPVGIKDNISTKGLRTTCASKMLGNYVPPFNATVMNKLDDIVVTGKLNMDEFAFGSSTETSAFGSTRNPWDLSRVPGGSSGGSAAAVGAHIVPQDILGDDDRPVEAAAEVGDHCDQQGRKQQGRPQLTQCGGKVRLYSRGNCCRICHDYPSLSLFCRMVSRTGVPSRPKVERIWFSR